LAPFAPLVARFLFFMALGVSLFNTKGLCAFSEQVARLEKSRVKVKPMNKLLAISEKVSNYAAWVSGGVLFATSILIAVEVTLRKVFSVSMGGADEISSYALAMACTWSFGFALFRKAHIRIDVLYVRLPKTVRYALDILSLVFFALYMVILTYYAYIVLYTSIIKDSTANTPLHTPLWIPQSLWLVGLIAFTITIFLILTGTIYNLLKKNFQAASALSGASTLEEDIEEEGGPTETVLPEQGGQK
jgi:TRAP-type C4-dicarboxylate transport system permease small subunit